MATLQEPISVDSEHKRNRAIISFESWIIRKAPGLEGREKSWTHVEKQRILRSSDDLAEDVHKRGKSGTDALLALTTVQQRHVNSLVEEKQRVEKRSGAEWSWVLIHLDFVGKVPRGMRRTSKDARAICVTLQRTMKIDEFGPPIPENLDVRFRKVNLHEDVENVVQVPDLQENNRGFASSSQPPDDGHQRPGTIQGSLHMPQPNAPGPASALQTGDPRVFQGWPQGYHQPLQAMGHPGSQQSYPLPPLGPHSTQPQMNYSGPHRTADVDNPLTPVNIPSPFADSRHFRGDETFRSRDGSQFAGSIREPGVIQRADLSDPQAEPPDIEDWRKRSTGPTYLPDRQERDRTDLDGGSRPRRGNRYYKPERPSYSASQGSSRYYKHKESVIQPARTTRRSPGDDNRHREQRPHRQDRRPSPRLSQRGRQNSYSRSPPPKHRYRHDRPRSSSVTDDRRGRDRTSRKNRSYTPDDDDYTSEHSSRSSSSSPSPVPRARRNRDRSAERRDDYSPTRTSRKERRENKRREVSSGRYRH